jgi:hypothetical protein
MHFQFCIDCVKYLPHLDVIISDKFKIDRRATCFLYCVLMTLKWMASKEYSICLVIMHIYSLHLSYSCSVGELYIMLQCHRRCILHLHVEILPRSRFNCRPSQISVEIAKVSD